MNENVSSAILIVENSNLFIKNEYYYEYLRILDGKTVFRYNKNNRKDGYHLHHILPKCVSGKYSECVLLTYEEHIEAHRLLFNCVANDDLKRKMAFAYKMTLCSNDTTKEYLELHKEEFIETCSRYRCPRGIGFKRSDKEKEKTSRSLVKWHENEDPEKKKIRLERISKARIGHIVTDNTKEKIKQTKIKNGTYKKPTFLGMQHTEETKKKISECVKMQFNDPAARKAVGERTRRLFASGKIKAPCPCKGKHWYTDGVHNVAAFECPDGYHPGRTIYLETIEKLKRAAKRRKSIL